MGLVLVIDDDHDCRRVLDRIVSRLGHQVLSVESGEAGLALLSTEMPGLIIVDGMMPGMNGVEFIRLLRASTHTAAIPAILYTAVSDYAFANNATEKGANEVWIKTRVTLDEIRDRLANYLS